MKSVNITQDELRRGLHLAARLVAKYGDEYWPYFERLERELKELESRQGRLEAAMRFKG